MPDTVSFLEVRGKVKILTQNLTVGWSSLVRLLSGLQGAHYFLKGNIPFFSWPPPKPSKHVVQKSINDLKALSVVLEKDVAPLAFQPEAGLAG